MAWYLYLAIIGAGVIAGFINTLAGSGSLVTLPLLIFLGLPATVANGTNRVAILLQNVVGVSSFHREQVLDWRGGLLLAVPAIFGSIAGAQIAVNLNETVMRQTIGGLMVVMLVIIWIRPRRWLEGQPETQRQRPGWKQMLIFFAIGVYGGFIQAGVGIFLLAGLVLGAGYNLVRANAVKVLIVLCFTVFALVVFILNGQVAWLVGLILAVGNMLGAWLGAWLAVRRGAGFVRWLLIGVVAVSAAELLGLFDLVGRWWGNV
ncbi:MAG: sulfite exporter TauE/SafE family protein [Anaerolineae bacterium]|nr:sulfite exporter TauE/SafE family protein [Anaerolineae bacterium]